MLKYFMNFIKEHFYKLVLEIFWKTDYNAKTN